MVVSLQFIYMSNQSSNPKKPNIERISMGRIWESIFAAFSLDRGLIYTLKALAFFPSRAIKTYLLEDRSKLMKPLRFLLLLVGLTTFIILQFLPYLPQTGNSSILPLEDLSPQFKGIAQWLDDFLFRYFNVFQLFKVPFLSLAAYWLFRKAQFNYAEHLVINAYIFSFQSLITTLIFPLILFPSQLFLMLLTIFAFGYMTYVFTKIYNEAPLWGILKSFACYFIANIFHVLFMILVFSIFYLLGWN